MLVHFRKEKKLDFFFKKKAINTGINDIFVNEK